MKTDKLVTMLNLIGDNEDQYTDYTVATLLVEINYQSLGLLTQASLPVLGVLRAMVEAALALVDLTYGVVDHKLVSDARAKRPKNMCYALRDLNLQGCDGLLRQSRGLRQRRYEDEDPDVDFRRHHGLIKAAMRLVLCIHRDVGLDKLYPDLLWESKTEK